MANALNSTMSNATYLSDLPPLPSYTLVPLKSLVPWIADMHLSLLLPIVAYWILSLTFHYIDVNDYWPQYRLHTPAEITKRNHVSRYEVIRDVIIQQCIQTGLGLALSFLDPEELTGKDDYNVAVWAQRIRLAQRALPQILAVLGLNALDLSKNVAASHPVIAGALAGGKYPYATDMLSGSPVAAFAGWELQLASAIYWYLVPAVQFGLAIFVLDTWEYFLHRAMHMNKWLYTTFHSRHHRLYVPYAFGALYNHPFEGFLLDTVGAMVAYKISFMSVRQGIWFFTCSNIKTVDDHCGYALPWDPLQHITGNNSEYHDIHHQSWGIKTNFSQPFFTFWDRALGTIWKGDTKSRYERSAKGAQFQVEAEKVKVGKDQ